MSDPEIIAIYLIIKCLGRSINKGYLFLKRNYPKLVTILKDLDLIELSIH